MVSLYIFYFLSVVSYSELNYDYTVLHSKYNSNSYIAFERNGLDYHELSFKEIYINLNYRDTSFGYTIRDEELFFSILDCIFSSSYCGGLYDNFPVFNKCFRRDYSFLVKESRRLGYLDYEFN